MRRPSAQLVLATLTLVAVAVDWAFVDTPSGEDVGTLGQVVFYVALIVGACALVLAVVTALRERLWTALLYAALVVVDVGVCISTAYGPVG